MKKYITIAFMAALTLLLAGCAEGDKFDPDKEAILMTGTDASAILGLTVEQAGAAYPLTVSTTGIAENDIRVDLAISAQALDEYNAAHGTSYAAVPATAVSLDSTFVVIRKGTATSRANNVTINDISFFEDGVTYAIPVTITNVEGSSLDVLENSRTAVIKIRRVINFNALDISDASLSSNYIFPDEKAIELSQYTYQIKFYATNLKSAAGQICRLCAWEAKDESKANMLRFNENGFDHRTLQLVSPAGNIVSNTKFDENKWYNLSLVYDGSTMTMYVDGVPEEKKGTGEGTTTFQRFELGMSWGGGYPSSQLFYGRICEIRVWDRALSTSELKSGFCGVPKDSKGLRAYWKLGEGEGHIFHDATGNGYDMDWSDTWRDASESGTLNPYDKSSIAEGRWVFDQINKCSD